MACDRFRLDDAARPLFAATVISLGAISLGFAGGRHLGATMPQTSIVGAKDIAGLEPRVEFREWGTPAKGEHPHDPLATPDGAIWYTGQRANLIGRLDPRSGGIKEFPLREPNSGPHGLVADKDGAIWFTAQSGGYIGRLDPRTGEVRAYFPKDGQKVDPHTPIFDRSGVLWFTAQSANMIGRLDVAKGEVAKGEIELTPSPTKDSAPYGVVVGADGALYVAEFGANKIARIDPNTRRIQEFGLPNEDARPRRIAASPDGFLWYTDFTRGRLGRLDPKSGDVVDWPSPGGAQSQPYAIAVLGGGVWYAETGSEQNMLVHFDPKTQRFASWPIPGGGGVVRNMMATPGGGLALALSGVDKIALVTISLAPPGP